MVLSVNLIDGLAASGESFMIGMQVGATNKAKSADDDGKYNRHCGKRSGRYLKIGYEAGA